MMQLEDTSTPRKSFWARPEGTTGLLVIGAALIGGYFALPFLLAFMTGLVALLGQTIAVVCLCLVLAALLFVITNKKVQTLVSYMFKSVMRKITGAFVEIDPIGIMKSYIEDLKKKRETMLGAKEKLGGQIRILEGKIKANEDGYENSMSKAKLANDKGAVSAFQVNSRQAGRLQKLNEASFKPMLTTMQIHMRALSKYYEVTGTVIEDLSNEVEAQKTQREMMMASYGAMSAAKKILMGGTDQRELFDQAMEFVVEDYGMKMGEIDSFMENSRGFVEDLDLQNGVYDADALKKLQEWETRADSILLGTGKQKLLDATPTSTHADFANFAMPAQEVDYSKLIARK